MNTKQRSEDIHPIYSSKRINDNTGTGSVVNEKNKVMSEISQNKPGLSIFGLSKTYFLSAGCCSKSRPKHALSKTYLEIPEDELFTLIGHNGAGKTTLINVLTGNIQPTSGRAYLSGIDLNEESAERFIGFCPQHDILWDELTAEEHFLLYCSLRNINKKLYKDAVDYYLKEVNLLSQKNNPVSTYSGGMKRRLSIMLSIVGDPKLLILDEPTTGLDPVNKRFIWKMIKNIKKGRSIILTTHAMEEAEFLSDRVGIIKEGEFQCIGTIFQLKAEYGSGYLLTFVVKNNLIDEALAELKRHIPSGILIATQGGSIIMNLPTNSPSEIKVFMTLFSKNEKLINQLGLLRLSELVLDCGMDYTTLEEIFIKITGKVKEINDVIPSD